MKKCPICKEKITGDDKHDDNWYLASHISNEHPDEFITWSKEHENPMNR